MIDKFDGLINNVEPILSHEGKYTHFEKKTMYSLKITTKMHPQDKLSLADEAKRIVLSKCLLVHVLLLVAIYDLYFVQPMQDVVHT